MRQKHPGMARIWGRMGGRPRKPTLAEIMGEPVAITNKGGCGSALLSLPSPPPKVVIKENATTTNEQPQDQTFTEELVKS
ncbi:MAG: hypothetical protein V1767_02215 [Chloroflexota bacterium]